METLYTIDLDVAHDSHPDGHIVLVTKISSEHNVLFTILQEIGPAGGNPLYRFTGSKSNLTNLVNTNFFAEEPGCDHCEFLLTFLKKV